MLFFWTTQLLEIRQTADRNSRMKFRGCNHPGSRKQSRARKSSVSPVKQRDSSLEDEVRSVRKTVASRQQSESQFLKLENDDFFPPLAHLTQTTPKIKRGPSPWVSFIINVQSVFTWANSLPENQSVCLNLWVSISPIIMKGHSNMRIFYLPWIQSKTTGEKTAEDWKPFGQGTHGIGVVRAMSDVKLHNQLEKEDAFILSYFNWKGCLLWGLNVNAF